MFCHAIVHLVIHHGNSQRADFCLWQSPDVNEGLDGPILFIHFVSIDFAFTMSGAFIRRLCRLVPKKEKITKE